MLVVVGARNATSPKAVVLIDAGGDGDFLLTFGKTAKTATICRCCSTEARKLVALS